MTSQSSIRFAPQLLLKYNVLYVSFYVKAAEAEELRRVENKHGQIHVVEFSVEGQA